jgi:hypothetical protein
MSNYIPQVGDIVWAAHFVGRVDDIATSPTSGRVMVLVSSPKGLMRMHRPEWLEFDASLIRLATPEDWRKEKRIWEMRLAQMVLELDKISDEYEKEIDGRTVEPVGLSIPADTGNQ